MKLTRRQMTCMATFTLALVALVVDRLWIVPRGATAAQGSDSTDAADLVVPASPLSEVPPVAKTLAERLDLLCAQYDAPGTLVRDAFRAPAGWAGPAKAAPPASMATQVEVQVQTPAAVSVSVETPEQVAARLAAEEANRKTAEEAKRREEEQALQQYQQQVTHKATELKLQSIIQSGTDTRCLIDDTLVRVGDRIKGFQVMQIADNWVHLLLSEPPMPDMKIVLKLSE